MRAAFFGHSDFISNKKSEELLLNFISSLYNGEKIEFLLGGYGNFDRFARNCCSKFKKIHNDCSMIFVSPYLDKAYLQNRENFYDSIIYPDLEYVPKKFAITKRNEWMAKNADVAIVFIKYNYGGAYNAYKIAQKHCRLCFNLFNNEKITQGE